MKEEKINVLSIKIDSKFKEEHWKIIKEHYLLGLVIPFFVAGIFGIIIGALTYLSLAHSEHQFLISFLIGSLTIIITTVAAFGVINLGKFKAGKTVIDDLISNTFLENLTNIKTIASYVDLTSMHLEVNWPLKDLFSDIIKLSKKEGGAIVIHAEEKEYFKRLKQCLDATNNSTIGAKSFKAILRGGDSTPKYTPGWFFQDSKEKEEQSRNEKQDWLSLVNDYKDIDRIRIMIFDCYELYGDILDLHTKEHRTNAINETFLDIWEKFLILNKGVKLYLIRKDTLNYLFERKSQFRNKKEWQFIWDDYAIFMDQLVLRYNNATQLFISIKEQIKWYQVIFDYLYSAISKNDQRCFKRVYKKRNNILIGNMNALEWFQNAEKEYQKKPENFVTEMSKNYHFSVSRNP